MIDFTKELTPVNNVVLKNFIKTNYDDKIIELSNEINRQIDFINMTIRNGTINMNNINSLISNINEVNRLVGDRNTLINIL